MDKKSLGWVLFAAAVIALVVVVIYNAPKKGLPEPEEEIIAGTLVPLSKTDRKIAREEERVSIDVTYPEFETAAAVINQDIKSFAEAEVANVDSLKLEEIPTMSDAQYFLKIAYDVEQANNEHVSLVFTTNLYTGGAHPNEYFRAFNYDTDSGTKVTLASLYPEEKDPLAKLKPKIKAAVREVLAKRLSDNGDTSTDPDELLFEDINDQPEDVFQNFTFSSDSITFYFSPYDIAPYAAGPIVAKIER